MAEAEQDLSDVYDVVQSSSRNISSTHAVAVCFKADTIDGCVHHRLTDDLGNHVGQFATLCKVDGFAAKTADLRQPLTIYIADDDRQHIYYLA